MRNFQQSEAAHFGNLNPGAILFHGLLHAFFDGMVVLRIFHVNKVDDNQSCQIAHSELFGDFVGRLQIGFERGFLKVFFLGGASGVYVDGNQSLGRIDDQIAARFQLNVAVVQFVELSFNLKTLKQRNVVFLA